MKHIPLIAFVLFLSAPTYAQEADGTPVPAASVVAPEDAVTRLALAQKMHEIWPIRTRIETAIQAVAREYPEEKQAQIKAAMRKSIQFDQVEEASIKAMAETFTEDELKAMIAFYGSDAGRSTSAKMQDYELSLRPIMTQMLDKAMLDLKTGMTP